VDNSDFLCASLGLVPARASFSVRHVREPSAEVCHDSRGLHANVTGNPSYLAKVHAPPSGTQGQLSSGLNSIAIVLPLFKQVSAGRELAHAARWKAPGRTRGPAMRRSSLDRMPGTHPPGTPGPTPAPPVPVLLRNYYGTTPVPPRRPVTQ